MSLWKTAEWGRCLSLIKKADGIIQSMMPADRKATAMMNRRRDVVIAFSLSGACDYRAIRPHVSMAAGWSPGGSVVFRWVLKWGVVRIY
jgi:hypothetical protein